MILQEIQTNPPKTRDVSTTGKIFIALTGGVALGLTAICAPFVIPALRKVCLPYIPATTEQLNNILIALRQRHGTLVDLGSGDGRIVLEAARKNFVSHGVELNPWLVLYSRFDAVRRGLQKNTKFFHADLWKFNLGPYENIIIFGVQEMMPLLEAKIRQECREGSNVIACRFPLPNLKPKQIIGSGIDTVWVYEVSE